MNRILVGGAIRDFLKAINPEASLVSVSSKNCLTVIRLPHGP